MTFLFSVPPGKETDIVSALISSLAPAQQVTFADPDEPECSLELRNTGQRLEIKRGCHGCYGSWRPATTSEAGEWLLPGAKWVAKQNANRREGSGPSAFGQLSVFNSAE